MTRRPPVVIRARGHEQITATHAKTFELTTDPSIGPEATCVIGVGAQADWDALGRILGPVALTVRVSDHSYGLQAEASPFWASGHGLVVRKSDFRGDDTLAVNADAAAADLDRALAAAMRDPAAEVEVAVRPLGDPPAVALFTDRLEPRVPDGVRVFGLPVDDPDVGDAELVLARPGAAIAAAQALLGLSGDVVVLGPLPKGKRAREERLAAARRAAGAVAVIATGTAPEDAAASAVFRPGEAVAPVRLGPPAQRVNAEDRVFSVLAGDPAGGGAADVGPLIQALLAEGVSARTLRKAVGRVPGLDRAWDYDAINRMSDHSHE